MAANLTLHMHKSPKIYLKSRPPLGELGVHFGAILRVLGGPGASWGAVWADSGSQARLGRRPGRLLGDFIGLDGPTWAPRWPQVGAQIAQKSMPSSIEFLMSLKIETWMEKVDILMEKCCFLDLIWD